MREDPAWRIAVELAPRVRSLQQPLMLDEPLVCRGSARHSADITEEGREPVLLRLLIAARNLEQPVERVVFVGDEPVEGGRRVVDRVAHGPAPRAYYVDVAVRTSRTASSTPPVHGSPCPGSTKAAVISSIRASDSTACDASDVNGAICGPRAPVVTE